jgi:hypothetical protein
MQLLSNANFSGFSQFPQFRCDLPDNSNDGGLASKDDEPLYGG